MQESRGIKSVETAGRLLEVLGGLREPAELRTLSSAAGMSASLAHAYLTSFARMGLVKRDPSTKQYCLGQFAIELGLSELRTLDPVELALSSIGRLRLDLDQTVALSVWGSSGPTVIRVLRGDAPLHATLYEGATLPLTTSATGRAFCAFLPPQVIQKALRAERAKRVAAQDTIFATAMKDARRHGLARISDQPIPGLVSFSAPVFNHAATMVCAITVTGRQSSIDADWGSAIPQTLLRTARALSDRLGSTGLSVEVAEPRAVDPRIA
jgi:DNA-binding IclR family transcriptional regulator